MLITSRAKDGVRTIYLLHPQILDETQQENVARDILSEIEKTTEEQVILDFQKVQFMSSSMLGKLVQIQKKCNAFKAKLKFCSIDPEILEVFKLTKLDELFDIEADEAAARKAISKRGLLG